MRNSKLYWILEHFDKYEQNRLRKFLQSPYFNKSQAIMQLFEVLIKDIQSEKKEDFSKEKIWVQLSLDSAYDDVRFRKYCSDLLKLIENYLAQQIYESKSTYRANHYIEAIEKKKLDRLYESSIKNIRKLIDQNPFRSSEFYLEQYLVEKNYYELQKHDRASKSNIEEINECLDKFYLSEKLHYYCIAIGRSLNTGYTYDIKYMNEILEYIKSNNYADTPSISIYYQIMLTQTDSENTDHYFRLKDLLEKNGLKFPREEATSMYDFAINYCIKKANQGNENFQRELFDLYKDLIKKELIIVDGELSPWDLRNITVVALRLGEYDWSEAFVKNYQHYLPEAFRQNAVNFNLAQIYFYQKKYDNVKVLLQEVEFEDFIYNLGSKAMLLAIYYETDELEPLYSLFESFRTYLNRHKDIPLSRRQYYMNLIKFTKKLTKIIPGDKKSLQKLKEELEMTKNVASYGWLMEKISELK